MFVIIFYQLINQNESVHFNTYHWLLFHD